MVKEGPPKPKTPEQELYPQMSPEDIAEMQGQIPILREMLEERRRELADLEVTLGADRERITALREEIAELEFEIEGREDIDPEQ